MHNKVSQAVITKELYIPRVIQDQECKRHNAPIGIPCFHIPRSDGFGYYAAVCNRRAKNTGFRHAIDENSLRINRQKRK